MSICCRKNAEQFALYLGGPKGELDPGVHPGVLTSGGPTHMVLLEAVCIRKLRYGVLEFILVFFLGS